MLSRLVSPHRNLDGEGLRRRNNRSKHANQVVPMGTTSPRSHTDRNFALDAPSLCPRGDYIWRLVGRERQRNDRLALVNVHSHMKQFGKDFIEPLAHHRPPVSWVNVTRLGELVRLLVHTD